MCGERIAGHSVYSGHSPVSMLDYYNEKMKEKETAMTEHKGLPVAGYLAQSDDKVNLVNENKVLEERVLRQIDAMAKDAGPAPTGAGHDGRMIALARTGIQEAFMWLNRAVFQPSRVKLPEDDYPVSESGQSAGFGVEIDTNRLISESEVEKGKYFYTDNGDRVSEPAVRAYRLAGLI